MTGHLPLVVVDDEDLLDHVLRIAASVGCEVECAPDAEAVRRGWSRAPLVVLDETALTQCAGRDLPRASSVVLVCAAELAAHTWQLVFRTGVEHVLTLPGEESSLVAVFADVVEGPSGGDGRVVAVVGGRGGAGASVFAASIGVAASRSGEEAVLVDCDPLGGGIDLVLGAEFDAGSRWPDLSLGSGRVSMSSLRGALPRLSYGSGELSVISCARDGARPDPDGVAAVVDAGRRSGATVACDLSRELAPCDRRAAELADLVCLVVPAEVRACTAATRVLERLRPLSDRLALVVRGPAPEALPAEAIAEVVGLPVLTVMRAEPRLGSALERGRFDPRQRGPLATGARDVLRALAGGRDEQVGAA
ncbi:helicase [Haloechinothrix sp. YIM 98757]|uniref:Helicase n=1 Tax=Haloechinothrix aidingensis TaxID=2752311 RepID=A0A838ADX6_9PSEU|nr:septum site-determining protein Ssd [Haloechinothrix aidingensis]MBA0127387.1 helicase [Haloechinothrix aidingensis]